MVNIPKLKETQLQFYEVIRVINNVPLFLHDHLERLYHSADLYQIHNLPGLSELREKIFGIINDSSGKTGNIKLSFVFKTHALRPEIELDFIPHFYPSKEKYVTGVKVGILSAERPSPQAKIRHIDIRNKANLLMSKERVFEVILIDQEGNITEGSRSNLFFVKGEELFTSPDEAVLQGITRKKILQLCASHEISVNKTIIPLSEIENFEGAFLTGSSPKVLPISAIADVHFITDLPLIKKIIDLYDKAIDEYLRDNKSYK